MAEVKTVVTTRYWQGFEFALRLVEEALKGQVHSMRDIPPHLKERVRNVEDQAVAAYKVWERERLEEEYE